MVNQQPETQAVMKILQPGEAESIPLADGKTQFLVRTSENDGQFALVENTLAPRFPGPPQHLHNEMSHVWYILGGQLQVTSGEKTTTVSLGSVVYIPAGIPHTFANPFETEARLLEMNLPGNHFDRYYDELFEAFPPGVSLNPQKIREIQSRYDTHPAI
jgi:mannose-6-phosphate isomerase-like protein (cupin superfamily)